MSEHQTYQLPLITRYASPEMARLWSEGRRVSTWRRLWVALAEAQRELGLGITEAQIEELAHRWTGSTSSRRAPMRLDSGTT